MIDKNELIKWFEVKGLSEKSIQDYTYYFDKINFEKLDQKYLIWFLQRYNNNISRALVKNIILYVKTNDFPEEIKGLINTLTVPKSTGRKRKRLPNVITKEQVYQIASIMDNQRDRIMVLLTFYCGLRMNELLNIIYDSFNWDVWIKDKEEFGEVKVIGKGDKQRKCLVLPELMESVYKWVQTIMANQYVDEPLFKIGQRRWQKILEKNSLKALGRRVNPHLLRHSLGAHLVNKGVDIRIIQEILGHSSITSTAIYTQLSKKKVVDSLKRAL